MIWAWQGMREWPYGVALDVAEPVGDSSSVAMGRAVGGVEDTVSGIHLRPCPGYVYLGVEHQAEPPAGVTDVRVIGSPIPSGVPFRVTRRLRYVGGVHRSAGAGSDTAGRRLHVIGSLEPAGEVGRGRHYLPRTRSPSRP
jgi:hypothetical protein